MGTIAEQAKLLHEHDKKKIAQTRPIPVFVEEGSIANPEDLPEGFVLIYMKPGTFPVIFGPVV